MKGKLNAVFDNKDKPSRFTLKEEPTKYYWVLEKDKLKGFARGDDVEFDVKMDGDKYIAINFRKITPVGFHANTVSEKGTNNVICRAAIIKANAENIWRLYDVKSELDLKNLLKMQETYIQTGEWLGGKKSGANTGDNKTG